MPREGGAQRSDTIILCAANLDGSGSLLLSVPRDAYVDSSDEHPFHKINAAYAWGGEVMLKDVLADSEIMGADLPYHLVFDSNTVRRVVDALGGIVVDVPHVMDYDDDWGNLHIHLEPGRQRLNGEEVVGYLRWRKNKDGRNGSDFQRTERQRQVIAAIIEQMRSIKGVRRLPLVYQAFRATTRTNMTMSQLVALGLSARHLKTDGVPGYAGWRRGISYVYCDWPYGRDLWEQYTQ